MLAALVILATPGAAQEFVPPDRQNRPPQPAAPEAQQPPPPARGGFIIDVLAFSTRGGAQVNGGSQAILGSTIDLVQLGTPRLRGRPSFEFGFGRPTTSVSLNVEVIYRFQPDSAAAIPYVGIGAGYYDDKVITRGWPTLAIGFELPYNRTMNWLVEYHALDRLRRSRLLIGLATRGGS